MTLFEILCGLLGSPRPDPPPEPPAQPLVESGARVLILSRSADSFYHSLPDEEFVSWIRTWSDTAQVLTPDDRECLIDRAHARSLALRPLR